MNTDKLTLLKSYLEASVSPLLIEGIQANFFGNAVVLNANIDKKELNGHYEGTKFCPPTWYSELLEKDTGDSAILIIDNINNVGLEEQKKFIELLKYKKISTFELPNDCLIIVTCSNLKKNKISEEVYSLLVHI